MKEIPVMTPEQEREAIQQENDDIRQQGINADYGNPGDLIKAIMAPILARWTPTRTTGDPKEDAVLWASYLNRHPGHIQWAKDAKEFRQALSPCAVPSCIHCDALREHIETHGLDEYEIRHAATPVPGKEKKRRVPPMDWKIKTRSGQEYVTGTDEQLKNKFQELRARWEGVPMLSRPPEVVVDRAIKKADLVNPTDPALVQRFGKPKQAVIWDDRGQPVRTEEEIPE